MTDSTGGVEAGQATETQAVDAVVDGLDGHPFLVCDQCGEFICTIDEGDYLSILTQTVTDHECVSS